MTKQLSLFTIGFTQKSAQTFFDTLVNAGVKRVIDIRLNNISQLAGFAKKADLKFFLKKIGDIEYIHSVDLAPTQEMLDEYKKKKGDWSVYEEKFTQLIAQRQIEKKIFPDLMNDACLLCSEAKPHHCHRRLVAEYLNQHWGNISIHHL